MTTLAELRLANLREQKKSAEPAPEPVSAPAAALPVPDLLPVSDPLPPVEREEDLVLSQFITPDVPSITQDVPRVAAPPIPDPDAEKSAALVARVHSLLAHKTLHPNGAKATVDMSPALFHRAKRYCLDHGNVTLRQLFLDLMTAFLDEEDY